MSVKTRVPPGLNNCGERAYSKLMSDGFSGAFTKRQAAPWQTEKGLEAVLGQWRRSDKVWSNVVLDREIPAQPPQVGPVPQSLHPGIKRALLGRGINQLYSHQAEAYERAHAGESLVVATPTASGKSLCYNLPVAQCFSAHPEARALFLFPTKALSRDQEYSLRGFLSEAGLDHGAVTYDGDTPGDARRAARQRTGILITNPDMLHSGILPHHAQWARFFANLRFVVIDELHTYRGVFGSHLSNVMRRLLRVAAFHGASPQFIFSSATIGNPREHASSLAGQEVGLIAQSGAPTGERQVLVYNPPVVNAELGIRQSYLKCAVRLGTDLVRSGVSTLIFGQSRNQVEVMLKYLRDRLPEAEVPSQAIQAYRGGYLPDTRRRIEQGLRSGEVRCVVATNALELGIDIGALDAVVCAGYPGSMAGLWQRFGRGGRRHKGSLALLVTSSAPLDQYMAQHPRQLFEQEVEAARIDPDNVEILIQHIKCAAYELPFEEEEVFGEVPVQIVQGALEYLSDHRVVRKVPGRNNKGVYHWSAQSYPASNVSLRSASFDNFVVVDVEREKTIAEMDFRSTHTMLHEQAIYQHEGLQYQVEALDYENHKAFVRKVAPDYYTTAHTNTRVSVLEEEEQGRMNFGGAYDLGVGLGDVEVVEKVVGYKKIKFHTHENVGYGEVNLPPVEKPTSSFWLTIPEALIEAVDVPRAVLMDALRGWLKALHGVAAVGLMMDPRDIGSAFVDEPGVGATPDRRLDDQQRRFEPTLYLYDSAAGGVGLAPRLYEERQNLILRSRGLIHHCSCQEGCPSCVGPVVGSEGADKPVSAAFSRKMVALRFLELIGLGLH